MVGDKAESIREKTREYSFHLSSPYWSAIKSASFSSPPTIFPVWILAGSLPAIPIPDRKLPNSLIRSSSVIVTWVIASDSKNCSQFIVWDSSSVEITPTRNLLTLILVIPFALIKATISP